jgi:hypothetical protein
LEGEWGSDRKRDLSQCPLNCVRGLLLRWCRSQVLLGLLPICTSKAKRSRRPG